MSNRGKSKGVRKDQILAKKNYLYSTTRDGKVKVTSEKQHRFLHFRNIPHTHVYKAKGGNVYRERSNA